MKNIKSLVDDLSPLQKTVTVDGIIYPIRWDFATALHFMEYVDSSEDEDETFVQNVLEIWYPTVPKNLDEALTQAIRFYCGGDFPKAGYYAPLFSPQESKEEIYHYFLNHFGINLRTETVHWWTVRQLMNYYRRGGCYESECGKGNYGKGFGRRNSSVPAAYPER